MIHKLQIQSYINPSESLSKNEIKIFIKNTINKYNTTGKSVIDDCRIAK